MRLHNEDKNWVEFIKETDTKTLTTGKDEKGTPYLEHIFRLHVLLFGETCTGCPTKIPHYINRIKNVNLDKMEQKQEKSLFRLKKGMMIIIPGSSKAYSEHNMTDEVAIKLLRENPNRQSLFEAVPENLEELLEQVEETKETGDNDVIKLGDKEFSIEEVRNLLEQVGVTTKATTVRGINDKIKALTEEQNGQLQSLVNPTEPGEGDSGESPQDDTQNGDDDKNDNPNDDSSNETETIVDDEDAVTNKTIDDSEE